MVLLGLSSRLTSSSGAALAAAAELVKRDDSPSRTIVVILPSFGERYLSTALFENIEG